MAGSRQGLSQVEGAALLQRGDHRIPGTRADPHLRVRSCVQADWEVWERDSWDEPHFPASEYLALMSTNIFRFILNIPHAVEMPREVVSVSGPLGLLPGSALLWAWQTSEDWCARHGDVSSGVASQGFLCLLHTCFWFLPQKNLWFE